MARKVSDEFTVPLCAVHHHALHARGDEKAWWAEQRIEPLPVADELWAASHDDGPWLAAAPQPLLADNASPDAPERPHDPDAPERHRDQVDP